VTIRSTDNALNFGPSRGTVASQGAPVVLVAPAAKSKSGGQEQEQAEHGLASPRRHDLKVVMGWMMAIANLDGMRVTYIHIIFEM
jgi:hypothetical protein